MAEDKLEWVFDSLVEFLKGPVWNIPVLTFIEQKSVVFEPGAENEEEFRKIHENYKNLVDFMLGSYMEDIQISPEQFEKACTVASRKAMTQFHQNLFEQVWAADDFEIFRRMMTQKNLELQLQALEVLAQKYGLSPDFMEPTSGCKPTKEEENIMKEIIRKAMEEQTTDAEEVEEERIKEEAAVEGVLSEKERLETQRLKEKELMDMAVKMSLKDSPGPMESPMPSPVEAPPTPNPSPTAETSEETVPQPDSPRTASDDEANTVPKAISPATLIAITAAVASAQEDEGEDEEKAAEENESSAEVSRSSEGSAGSMNVEFSSSSPQRISPMSRSPTKTSNDIVADRPWSDGVDTEYTKTQIDVAPIEMERRQNYLRQQRDRLLAMKRQERAKKLSSYERTAGEQRPKSARAARKILRDEHDSQNVDPQTLAFRKSLASRLRSEVVDKTD